MTDEIVDRLYQCLVRELGRRNHDPGRPLRVSDVYEDLVPYAAVRSALGVELKADYEHALLRLLAGDRDRLRLEPPDAREALAREVEAPYPAVGAYRRFAEAEVWVTGPLSSGPAGPAAETGGAGEQAVEGADASTRVPPPAAPTERRDLPARGARERESPPAAPLRLHREASRGVGRAGASRAGSPPAGAPAKGPSHGEAASDSVCAFCARDLPDEPSVRFCPYCGRDQRPTHCPRCDAPVDRAWRFCIECGHDVGGAVR